MINNIRKNAIKYSNLNGVPSRENTVAKELIKDMKKIGDFEFERDNLGSLAIIKKSKVENAPTVLISAHMDEVGFLLTSIDKNGFGRIQNVGGWWPHVILGQRFTLTTSTGEEIIGVAGCKPPHLIGPEERNKVVALEDIYLDFGAETKEEVEKWGVQIGDMITPYQDSAFVTKNKNRVVGKAHDDRICVVTGIEIMREIANKDLAVNVILVGSTQEEVGLRGAKTATYKWTPDIGFAIDVTFCYQTPGMRDSDVGLGNGVALGMFDRSVIANVKLLDSVREHAKKEKIPFGMDWVQGGTDSGAIHLTKDGVINMTVSIPCRYFHTHNSVIDIRDAEHTAKLLSSYIEKLDKKAIDKLRFK